MSALMGTARRAPTFHVLSRWLLDASKGALQQPCQQLEISGISSFPLTDMGLDNIIDYISAMNLCQI